MECNTQTQLKQSKIQFFYLPNEIAERTDLTASDKLLVAVVHTVERITGSPQVLTNRKIAELAGLSQSHLPQRIAKIKDKGVFTVTGQSTARRIAVNLENREGRFWRLPANEKQTHFKASERIVLGTIETLTTKKRRCTASNRFIGAAGGMSVQTVQSALQSLRKAGIVLSTKKFDLDSCKWQRKLYVKPKPEIPKEHPEHPEHPEQAEQPYAVFGITVTQFSASRLRGFRCKEELEMNKEYIAHGADDVSQATLFDDETEPKRNTEPKKEPKPKSEIYQLFDEYTEQAKQLKEHGRLRAIPAINYGKAGKMAKRLIECYGLEEVKKVVHTAARDEWVITQGFTLSTILSTAVFNRLMNGGRGYSSNTTARERYGTDRVGVTDAEMDFFMAKMERSRQEAMERIRAREAVK